MAVTETVGGLEYRLVHGAIRYTHDERMRGHERFTISVHRDGSRILRTFSEIFETRVVRDVSMRVDDNWHPRDAFVRVTVDNRFRGSGWFVFDEHEAQGEALHAPASRLSQRVRLDAPVRSFGTHPILGDGWHTALFDMAGPPQQYFEQIMMSSYAFDGSTGPELLPVSFGIELVGREQIEVPAGEFRTRHFRFLLARSAFDDHPPYDVWVTDDGDYVMVRAYVGDPRHLLYELERYEAVRR
ncbi:MAG: hypothetical protein AMJ58_03615 [Gammaproteobacteria bacterium SG8_30]|jgi:hypothetical protein|nr:MAG: hypothetical protein AMJ58_03615 [Gammaproteobacteria bacterium SG8_30]